MVSNIFHEQIYDKARIVFIFSFLFFRECHNFKIRIKH